MKGDFGNNGACAFDVSSRGKAYTLDPLSGNGCKVSLMGYFKNDISMVGTRT
jgi:hypothetical protein